MDRSEPHFYGYIANPKCAATGLSTAVAEDWSVNDCTLRRVGWLDQKGRVWTELPDYVEGEDDGFDRYGAGSFTPLLIAIHKED